MGTKRTSTNLFLIGLISIVILMNPVSGNAQDNSVSKGVTWLLSTQNPDGSWSSGARNFLDSYTALESLLFLNVSNAQVSSAINWVSGLYPDNTDDLSNRVLLLSLTGRDMSSEIVNLLTLMSSDNGWGLDRDFSGDVLDTLLALKTLKTVNYSDQTIIYNAITYLLNTQNSDGGWGFYSGDDSNVYMTALVSSTLQQFAGTTSLATAINKATTYLLAHQNADGGFGEGGVNPAPTTTVYETALAYIALIVSGQGQAQPLQNAINYLQTTQLSDGSWDEDPYSTALALRALANVKPDLSISSTDIIFSNPTPASGETITITANIKNNGPAAAENVLVRFYDGDPTQGGISIGETTILSIPAYGNSSASISWTIPTASAHIICVQIDPLNAIEESDKTDNISYKNLTSATLPDLSISSADISFSPQIPLPVDIVTITATIRNKGETGASNVTVDIYDGNPAAGGVSLLSTTIPSISASGSAAVQLSTNFTAGSHNIYLVVDKANSIQEGDKTNNTAVKGLQVGGGYIDLSVARDDISFNPAYPVEGNTVTLNAIVRNDGEAEAKNVLVRFYLGDPDSGGTRIGPDVSMPSITARGNTAISAIWDSTGHAGNNDIYVKVDPLNTITETNESNNKAFKTVKVAAKTGPDLAVAQGDINFIPLTPNRGDVVTITAKIRNIGTADATNVPLEFSLGDPGVGGTLIIGSQTIPSIPKGGSVTAQMSWNTTGFSGTYEIYVNADPFNEIAELGEKNNMAHSTLEINAPQGSDIIITLIDTTNLITDIQTLAVTGSIKITLQNKGNQPTGLPFEIKVFEDRNGNKQLDDSVDNILGQNTYTNNLLPGATDTIAIPVSGSVLFRDNLIYVMADSGDAIVELDETNNMKNTGEQCQYKPPVGSFNPVEKWRWTGSAVMPDYNQVMHTPVVARIADTNNDGVIDDKDVPAVIFSTFSGANYRSDGVLRAVRGDNGQEIFTVTNPAYRTIPGANIAVGDIDNDGYIEIVAVKDGGGIIVFGHDGTFKWSTTKPAATGVWGMLGGPSIADIDNDGNPEIILGATVISNTGVVKWEGTWGQGNNISGPLSIVADINLDGVPEILAGNTIYRNDGSIMWKHPIYTDGFNAVAKFGDDPYPEFVLVHMALLLFDHTGQLKWPPVYIPGGGYGGAPVIADFDGDGKPEIGIAGYQRYVVFRMDGTILWQSVIQDYSSNSTGSSVFDFDGDGHPEVVYNDEVNLRVYRGSDGQVLFETPNSSATGYEYPVIVDVDNDNRAEIVVAANDWYSSIPRTHHGIRVFKDANDNWVNTRKIWNQHSYHITNVNDDGTIPRYEENNWETYNNYRCNSLLPNEVLGTSDMTVSYISVNQVNYPSYVTISARIGNGGAVSQAGGVDVAFYNGDPSQGGVLIATSKTTKVLEPGDFEDVAITWNNPPSGSHTIFVVANKDNTFNECRKDNNSASLSFAAGAVTPPPSPGIPDLSISASDIAITPPAAIEGQGAALTAIVHNTGTQGASNVVVSFYDGDPKSGGVLIGSVTKSYIDAGATALAEISWTTFGQSGRNYIHVIVDPDNLIAESNEDNNSALIPVDVTAPSKPDLAITSSDMSFSDLNPQEGAPLTLNATIHNFGTDASDIEVALYDGNPASGGILLSQQTVSQIIPFGGKVDISFGISTSGSPGGHNFYISVDPNNRIDEINETNNIAWNSLTIGPSGLSLGISTDKTSYTANEDIQTTLQLKNLTSSSRPGTLEVKIVDLSGNVVSTITNDPSIILAPNENRNLSYPWNTGQTLAGDYKAYCQFIEGGNVTAKAEAPVTISPVKSIVSRITADKISYTVNQTAAITATITSMSTNYIFENLNAVITVKSPQGLALFTDQKPIQTLVPGQLMEFKTYWNISTNPKGTYSIELDVSDGTTVLNTASATFMVLGASSTGDGLMGAVTAQPNPVDQGKDETLSYSISNKGNEDVSTLDVKVLIVNPDTQEMKQTFDNIVNISMNASVTGTFVSPTISLMPRNYIAVLQVSSPVMTQPKTLASASFTVNDVTPPTVSIISPVSGGYYKTAFDISAAVTDDSSGVDTVQYQVDSGQWNPLPVTDPSTGKYSTAWSPVKADEGSHTINFRATDKTGNTSQPASTTFTIDLTPPVLSVSTLSDGSWTNNEVLNISGQTTDNIGVQQLTVNNAVVTVNPDGSFSYPVVLQDGPNTITVKATDLAGNETSDTRTINLDRSAPNITIITPADNIKTKQSSIYLTGTVDKESTVMVKVNAADPVPAAMNGNNFSLTITPVYGLNTIEATATDRATNTSTTKRTVTFDDQNPSLSVADPSQDIKTNKADMTIKGETADLTAVTITITVDGNIYEPALTGGKFEQPVTFTEEKTYQISVKAVDEAGNETTVQRNVIYKVTSPAVTMDPVTSPTNFNTQTLTGTMEAGAIVSVTCSTATVGTVSYPTATTWTATLSDVREGSNAISVTATDDAGNTSLPISANITVDLSPPVVTVSSPVPGGSHNSAIDITTLATDNISGVDRVEYQIDNGTWTSLPVEDPSTGKYSTTWTPTIADNGNHTISFRAADKVGNMSIPSAVNFTVQMDNVPPVTTITAGMPQYRANGQLFVTSGTVFTLGATDNYSGVAKTEYRIDGGTWTVYAPFGTTGEGVHTIEYRSTDNAGNVEVATVLIVTIDSTPSTGAITINAGARYTNNPAVTLTPNASDGGSGVAKMCVSGTASCAAWEDYATTKSWTLSSGEGVKTIYVWYQDRLGNTDVSPYTASITLDTTPPVLSVSTLSDGSWTNNPLLNISGQATDNTGIQQLTINGAAVTINPDGTFGYSVTLQNGPNTVSVTVTDLAGNQATDTRTINLDTVAPSSTITSPSSGLVMAATLVINGTASDSGSGVRKVEISTDGGATWRTATGTASWSFNWTIPTDGTYTIKSRATDNAGNVETPGAGLTVSVYKRLPTSVSISGGQLRVNGNPFTIKGVVYSPVPIGADPETMPPYGDYFTSGYNSIYDRDLPPLREMGANTLRLWTWDGSSDHHDFLDKAYNGGNNPIYLIAGYRINPGLDIDPQSSSNVRQQLKDNFRAMVASHKNHPAILMWAIDNDLNADSMYGRNLGNLFSLINEMAAEAHAEEGSSYHPVTTALTDSNLIPTISSYDTAVPALDVWGENVYRGNTFGTLFKDFKAVSSKPLAILEYGIDAFDNVNGDEYENIGTPYQATYAEALWNEIKGNSDVCIGGSIMEYSDEWWKGKYSTDSGCPDNNPVLHSTCGHSMSSSPDGYANEEWWGIMRTKANASGSDTMEARVVYYTLQELWTGSINAPHISVSPDMANFGSLAVGATPSTQSFAISNAGTENLVISAVTLSGINAFEFVKHEDHCSGYTLIPSKTCTFQVAFLPTTSGSKSATLSIPSNDPGAPTVNVGLSGTATVSIAGTVTSGQGPLSGVTVTLSGSASKATTTDASGDYKFAGLVNGSYTVTPSKTGYTFTPASSSLNINGASVTGRNFMGAMSTFTVTPSAGGGGSISPSTPQTVNYNGTIAFTITPNTGYHIADVVVDGVSNGAISSYTFTNVVANHTISASFAMTSSTLEFGVFGATGVTMSGGYVDSYDSTAGPYSGAHGANGPVGTNSTARGAITMSGGSIVYGNAWVGPAGNPAKAITMSGGAVIYGTRAALPSAKDMTPRTDPGGGTQTTFTNGTTLTSGTYRVSSITLSGSGTGTINGNVTLYVTGSIAVSGTAKIVILPGGSLTVYVNGSINVSGSGIVNQTFNPHALTIYGTSTCTSANYSGSSALYGSIYTPRASIAISGGSGIYGSVIGGSVTMSGGATVHYNESL